MSKKLLDKANKFAQLKKLLQFFISKRAKVDNSNINEESYDLETAKR